MIELNLQQGTPDWTAARAKCYCASEAPAMMGVSSYQTRSELLRQKATGIIPEVDSATQQRFDAGHEAEAAARPLAEAIIGEELYPIVATDDSGKYLASSDGATMLCSIGFEHKLWNEGLATSVRAGTVPESHKWQLVHQELVFGFEKILFVVSDGTPGKFESCWFSASKDDLLALHAGWKQFEADQQNYQHVEEAPAAVGRAPEMLPALHIEVTGKVTASNLVAFKEHAMAVFAGISTDLKTDSDFANAEKTVKWCGEVEERLEAAKQHALSQTASIDELFRAIDAIKAEARAKRLELDKLVKARKEAIRIEIQQGGVKALAEHVATLNQRLSRNFMPTIAADFAGVMKGLKTIASLRNAVDTELARAKIAASEAADKIEINLKAMSELSEGFSLFPDLVTLVLKPADDFAAAVKLRVAEHKARIEAERERIRQEEQARIAREQAAKAERIAKQQAAQAIEAAKAEPTPAAPMAVVKDSLTTASIPQADTGATLKLGDICTRLGLTVTADFLAVLGFKPTATDKNAKLYAEANFPLICAALVRHITAVANAPVKLAA